MDTRSSPATAPLGGASLRALGTGVVLAMLTAALVTLVVAIGVLPAISSGPSGSDAVGRGSTSGGTTVAAGLDQARSAALSLAAATGAVQAIASKLGSAPAKATLASLNTAYTAAGPAVVRIVLTDATGRPHVAFANGGPVALPDAPLATQPPPAVGQASVSAPFVTAGGDHQLTVATGVTGTVSGHAVSGVVLVTISLDALGAAAAGAPGVTAPAGLPAAPFWLAVMVVLLAGGTWAVRRALRPARQLAESHAALESRYQEAVANAYLDGLTGLGNQRAFQEAFERCLAAGQRDHQAVALLLIDLDDFKRVNDTDGHSAGDELLRRFARLMQGTVRRTDRAFRLGGDEFGVLMPATDAAGAGVLARRLLATALEPSAGGALARLGTPTGISFSGGVTAAPHFGVAQLELYRQADAALYWSKRHGRTSVSVYDPERHDLGAAAASVDEATAVQTVLDERLLRAVFQPIVALATGRIIGYEGLIRPTRGMFSDPGAMFAAAEACGRTIELDRACLETVAAAAAAIPADRWVSLNLSPRTLEAPEFNALALCRHLARLGLPSQRIVLELTEREAIEDLERLRHSLEGLRALGVRVAADDVGAGNAGLRLLSLVPFDVVKVDLSLVQDAATRQTSAEILETLQELASRRGAMVIAEGLETPHQLQVVRAAHIEAAQGYLLGRPAEAVDPDDIDLDDLAVGDNVRKLYAASTQGPWQAPR
ncbi:MAG: putative bifunctional diguanylate cyclase/phosphodiesterase [Candidatus Limnocylindrales bacterium]